MAMTPPFPLPAGFDAKAFGQLCDLDPTGQAGVVPRVLRTFETSLQRQMQDLTAALHNGDLVAAGKVAHTVKSAAAAVGALKLSARCAEVESLARSGDPTGVVPRSRELLTEAENALAAVRAMLQA